MTDDERDAQRWLLVTQGTVRQEGDAEAQTIFTRHTCTHCGLCAQVCPSGAVSRNEQGQVVSNPDRCIGCKYCLQACPFNIPRFSDEEGDKTMRKCSLCQQRLEEGEAPGCVEYCTNEALKYGDLEELAREGDAAVRDLAAAGYSDATLYGAEELGGIGVLHVLAYAPERYGLPGLPA